MRRKPVTYRRPSTRLKGHDYTQAGAYFVTMVTWQRMCTFGDAVEETPVDAMPHVDPTHALGLRAAPSYGYAARLNEFGEIARRCWLKIPDHFPSVELDAFVVMPNHVYGVVVINVPVEETPVDVTHVAARPVDPTHALGLHKGPKRGSVAAIVGSYKSAVSRQINALRGMTGVAVWQSNYYEHVVRDERALDRIREYIQNNPARWATDKENPERAIPDLMRDGE